MISIENISLRRGTKLLLEGANAAIHPGQKIALIGANGAGKSTFFQMLLHNVQADSGNLRIPAHWRVAHMAQEVAASGVSALDYVLDGDVVFRETERAIALAQENADNAVLGSLYQKLDDIDGYSAQARAEKLLHGLGFATEECARSVNTFSGGWRIRLNLAQALMCPSDLLLLDEPTNHLDIDASLWLEDWLRQYSGTLLLISHDRDFIDGVCEAVLQIEQCKLWTYRGNYSSYEVQRAERLARDQANFERQQRRIAEINRFVSRFRAKATKARQAQSRLKELERMERLSAAHVDSPFDFSFPAPDKFSDPLLSLSGASLGYRDKAVLTHLGLSIHPGSRIGLLGANGAGKSTLIRSLAGEIPLVAGERVAGEHLRIGYFSQHQVDTLDLEASPIQTLQRMSPQAPEQGIRDFLGGFDFRGDMAKDSIARFSGGEKARLALALIVWQKPNLLLLDEPTNHLDLEMRHALTVALQSFEGAMVLVSHDRHLIRNTVDQLLLVHDGRVEPYQGDMDEYSHWLLTSLKAQKGKSEEKAGDSPTAPQDRKRQRQQAAEVRKQLAPLKKALGATEAKMASVDEKLAALEARLADTSLYEAANRERMQEVLLERGALQQQKEAFELEWLEQMEMLEELEAELGAD
ncbi:MAG: ATP-binding cassette domain-containing protein [Porticoccaceae bacterium]